jgi:hypothetical protein
MIFPLGISTSFIPILLLSSLGGCPATRRSRVIRLGSLILGRLMIQTLRAKNLLQKNSTIDLVFEYIGQALAEKEWQKTT